MSLYAKIVSLSYDSAEAVKATALKTYYRSVRLIKDPGVVNPGQQSYVTNILLCGNCIDAETRKLYVFYIDVFYGSAWIIEIGIDDRVQKVVYYDKDNNIGFNHLHKIYNARVVNGRIIWTDNNMPIYQIDIERAKNSYYYGIGYNGYATVEWSEFDSYNATQIVSYGKYFYKALIDNNAQIPGDDDTVWERLCSIEDAYYSMNVENFYFAPMPPKYPPIVNYVADTSRNINNLKQTLYQFAYRYIYIDWRKSTYSPASIVPLPQGEEETATGLASEMISLNNSLRIQVNLGGEEVRAVEVIARSSDDPSTWFRVETIEKYDDPEKGGIRSKLTTAAKVDMSLSVMQPTVVNTDAPVAPVATAGTNLISTSFSANWLASARATGYYLDVSTDSTFATYLGQYHNRYVGNVLTFSITGLQSNNSYYFRVRAYNTSSGLVSEDSNVITVIIVLDAPVALEATDVTATTMTANWQAVAGATGYYLDVAEDNLFTVFVAGYNNKNVGNVLSDAVTGLVINTSYFYRVRAYNALGTSVSSNIINQRTQAPPSDVVATAATGMTLTSFYANWQVATGVIGTYSGYLIDVATDAAFTNILSGYNARYVGNVLTFLVRLLNPNTRYYYRIKGINAHGISSVNHSNTILALTLLTPPVALEATDVFETGMTANWETVTGATGYKLDVSLSNVFATFVAGYEDLDVGNVTEYDIIGLTINTAYFYRLRAYTAEQTSDNSNQIDQRTQAPPSNPIALPATDITLTTFMANWEMSTGVVSSYSGYVLEIATDSSFANIVSTRDVGNVTTYIGRLLNPNTLYYYRVKAYNAHGVESGYSNTISVRTLLPAPVALEASNVTSISMTANWQAVVGVTGYYLDVAEDNLFTVFVAGYNNLNVGSVTSYGITGLAVNTSYFYRVRAYTASQTSASSNTIDQRIMAPPSNIVALAASAITQSSFYANWEASTVLAAGYLLDVATDAGFLNKVTGYDNKDVGNALTYIVRLLTAGTNYWYRIKGYNSHGVLSVNYSNVIATATLPQVAPDAPVATAATNTIPTGFTANWNAVAGAVGYLLDVSNDARTWRSFVAGYNGLNVGNVLSYNVTGLTSGVQYYYRVRAYNADGTSVVSNTIYVTTSAPPAPTISLNPSMVIFGGTGSEYTELIYVNVTNALNWQINTPSANDYIHVYQTFASDVIELYYDGPGGSNDIVEFQVNGLDGSIVKTTFTGRLM